MGRRTVVPVLLLGFLLAGRAEARDVGKAAPKVPSAQEKALVEVCREICKAIDLEIKAGRAIPDENYCIWSARCLEAERAVSQKPADVIEACKAHLQRMQEAERIARKQHDAGVIPIKQALVPKYYRVKAEILLAQLQSAR
jgi:hypothetical protein